MSHEDAGWDQVIAPGGSQRVGSFRFYLDGQRWEWSDAVCAMHGYPPGTVEPTTDLVLQHKHPDDKSTVAALLDEVRTGAPFSSRHRILDTTGRTHRVIVVGDSMRDTDSDRIIGTTGFYIDVTETHHADLRAVFEHAVAEFTESRAIIERAKGALMLTYGISSKRAFDILAWRSQDANIKVKQLASQLLDAMSFIELPNATRTEMDHVLLTTGSTPPPPGTDNTPRHRE